MPKSAFSDLWKTVESGKVWQGYVKNKCKNGSYYWVYATVYPYTNNKKEQCYISIRRKPTAVEIEKHEKLYKSMS